MNGAYDPRSHSKRHLTTQPDLRNAVETHPREERVPPRGVRSANDVQYPLGRYLITHHLVEYSLKITTRNGCMTPKSMSRSMDNRLFPILYRARSSDRRSAPDSGDSYTFFKATEISSRTFLIASERFVADGYGSDRSRQSRHHFER